LRLDNSKLDVQTWFLTRKRLYADLCLSQPMLT
jgi:hypothetical protein